MRQISVFTIVLSLWLSTAWASGPGTTSANFLKAGQGVRPVGMGETYAALGNGLDTLSWNPAGLIQMSSPAVTFNHNFWYQDIGTEYLAYGTPLGPVGALAGGLTFMHAGSIQQTLEDTSGNYAGTGGQATASSIAFIGGYAQKVSSLFLTQDSFLKNVLIGGSLRIISESIADTSVFGGGVDLGAIWRQTEEIQTQSFGMSEKAEHNVMERDKGWRAGFVAQNLGATTNNLLPMNFRAGIGYVLTDLFSPLGRGTIAADAMMPIDNTLKFSLGAEYAHISANTEFAVRLGYRAGSEIKDLDSMAGLTGGVGLAIQAAAIKYQLDYAFVPYGDLGAMHRVSLTLAFFPSENPIPMSLNQVPLSPALAQDEMSKPKPETSSKPASPALAKPAAAAPAALAASTVEAKPAASRVEELRQALDRMQTRMKNNMLTGIEFKKGEATLLEKSKQTVDQLGRLLERYPEASVTLVGYDTSQQIASDRAKAIAKVITMSYRVSPDKVNTKAGDAAKQPKNTAIGFEVTEVK